MTADDNVPKENLFNEIDKAWPRLEKMAKPDIIIIDNRANVVIDKYMEAMIKRAFHD